MGINTDAPVVTRDEIVIAAPIEVIWEIQVDVDRWTEWQADMDAAQADGPLGVGESFRWRTSGLDITSTITRFEPPRHIEWGGPANGIVAVHVWELEDTGSGVRVRTEESWEGPPIDAAVAPMQAALDASLAEWLRRLKDRAEARV